ncbi:MAG: cyclic nucleotide-binding domain-containing protein [Desulfosalsimonadaceae bacterium]
MHLLDPKEIKEFPVFRELSPKQWSEVYPLLHHIWTIEGEELIREGDRAHTFFIILNGHFMVHYNDDRAFTLNQRGEIIGWSSVIRPFRYTANVTSLTNGEMLSLVGAQFLDLLQANASLGDKLVKKINEDIRHRPLIT